MHIIPNNYDNKSSANIRPFMAALRMGMRLSGDDKLLLAVICVADADVRLCKPSRTVEPARSRITSAA